MLAIAFSGLGRPPPPHPADPPLSSQKCDPPYSDGRNDASRGPVLQQRGPRGDPIAAHS